jgi:hypothetical protein
VRFGFSEGLLFRVDPNAVEVGVDDSAAKLFESKEKLEEILLHQLMDKSMEQWVI